MLTQFAFIHKQCRKRAKRTDAHKMQRVHVCTPTYHCTLLYVHTHVQSGRDLKQTAHVTPTPPPPHHNNQQRQTDSEAGAAHEQETV